jgi:hypothetical protein
MTDIKHLVSPFKLIPPVHGVGKLQIKQMPRQPPTCNCDSDEDNDFGMAPECAFVCNNVALHNSRNATKKRRLNAHAVAAKKTRRGLPLGGRR